MYTKPKQNISAFMFFVKLNKKGVKKDLVLEKELLLNKPVTVTYQELGIKLGSIWSELGDGKKQYNDLASKDMLRYIREMKIYHSIFANMNKQFLDK